MNAIPFGKKKHSVNCTGLIKIIVPIPYIFIDRQQIGAYLLAAKHYYMWPST